MFGPIIYQDAERQTRKKAFRMNERNDMTSLSCFGEKHTSASCRRRDCLFGSAATLSDLSADAVELSPNSLGESEGLMD